MTPFIDKIIENLIKTFLGEEYKLPSDIIDILDIKIGHFP